MRILLLMLTLAILSTAHAGDWEDALWGGLFGGGLGALVGELDSDIDTAVSIPLFAGLGALAGYGWGRDRGSDGSYYWGEPRDYEWRYSHWRNDWYPAYRWRGSHARRRPYRRVRKAKAPPAREKAPPPPNYHPGVELVTVPIALPNGTRVDLRIIKIGERYVGPQGEEYTSLPTSEVLAAKYAP